MNAPITIDVYSDIVCPWCYLGKRRLEAALRQRPDLAVVVRWLPFELNPELAEGGVDRSDYIARKFGDGAGFAAAERRLLEFGREAGIAFGFGQIARVPNTRAAHALVAQAAERAGPVVEGLFAAYFERGLDVGDAAVLTEVAVRAGLDVAAVRGWLATRAGYRQVEAEQAEGQRLGISGVPFFVFAGRWALSGAQQPEQMIAALDEVRATLEREATGGFGAAG